jgi:hypothetical protein
MDDIKRPPAVFVEDPSALANGLQLPEGEELPKGADIYPGLVRYPPSYWTRDNPPSLATTEFDVFGTIHLIDSDRRWRLTHDPVFAVESIISSHEEGYYPSLAVMEWLAEGFKDWLNHHSEKKSLERCLGFKRGASGQGSNRLKEAVRHNWTSALLKQMSALHVVFGIKVEDAAEMVRARLLENPALCTHQGFTFKPQDAKTLVRYRSGNKLLDSDSTQAFLWKKQFRTNAQKWMLLREYPFSSWEKNSDLAYFASWAQAHISREDLVNPERRRKKEFLIG